MIWSGSSWNSGTKLLHIGIKGYDIARAETRVRAIADTVRTVLDHADATGATPLAAALEIARRRVAEASSPITA